LRTLRGAVVLRASVHLLNLVSTLLDSLEVNLGPRNEDRLRLRESQARWSSRASSCKSEHERSLLAGLKAKTNAGAQDRGASLSPLIPMVVEQTVHGERARGVHKLGPPC
jgi:hypothetical protein